MSWNHSRSRTLDVNLGDAGAVSEPCDLAKSCRTCRPESDVESFMTLSPTSALSPKADAQSSTPGSPRSARRRRSRQAETAVNKHKRAITDLSVFDAYTLAAKFNLPAGQVTNSWKMFKRYDAKERGILCGPDFQLLIRAILRERYPKAADVPRELFRRVDGVSDEFDFLDLLAWVTEHAFSELWLLTPQERYVREVARAWGVPLPDVEDIKRHFDRFDVDGSGSIEYSEFCELLRILLKLQDDEQLPESRTLAFWRQLDDDCSGEVEFQEFIPWYLNHFYGDNDQSPIQEFYRNIRPVPGAYNEK